jgi:predicted short-subunit dehydrogenase-like oxidoreductase (DUF2520 family)
MMKIGFIGAGTVGTALAVLLSQKGYEFVGASRRHRGAVEKMGGSGSNLQTQVSNLHLLESNQVVAEAAEIVFITTPDDAIGTAVKEVEWKPGQSVVHCSGADTTYILEPARQAGARVGCFHPLQTLASVRQAIENIPGSTFALEAEEPLLTTLKEMATALGGRWIILKAGDKVAYHAAAVFASNYLVTLVKMSADLWQTFGVPTDQATKALLPLIRGTLNNIENIGIPQCLTGPIARGDTGTVNKHIETLYEKAPSLLSTYKELGRQTIPIATGKGKINEKQARELETILKTNQEISLREKRYEDYVKK